MSEPLPSDTQAIDDADVRHSWHPFTQMKEYLGFPRIHIARAQGFWLEDTDGHRYLDGNSSLWTNVHGHNDPDLNAALVEQLNNVAHATMLGLNHPAASRLSARLAGLTGNRLQRVFFTDCGAAGVEAAVKLSLQYWQLTGHPERQGIIAMRNAYHGDTFGTMALGDNGAFHERFRPWFFPVDRMPAPVHEECDGRVTRSDSAASLAALDALLEAKGDRTACLVIEPRVQGSGGMLQQPPGFLKEVERRCRRHGVHLILDEIFVGFGRLGHLLVGEAEGVHADFICLAKGLTAGYMPLAATLASDAIHEAFLGSYDSCKTFFHGHTFTGNPLACAVALRSLEKLEAHIAAGRLQSGIAAFGRAVREAFEGHPHVRELRQMGFTAAITLSPADPTRRWPANQRSAYRICHECRERGVILRPLGDTLLIVPAPTMPPGEIALVVRTAREAVDALAPTLPSETSDPHPAHATGGMGVIGGMGYPAPH